MGRGKPQPAHSATWRPMCHARDPHVGQWFASPTWNGAGPPRRPPIDAAITGLGALVHLRSSRRRTTRSECTLQLPLMGTSPARPMRWRSTTIGLRVHSRDRSGRGASLTAPCNIRVVRASWAKDLIFALHKILRAQSTAAIGHTCRQRNGRRPDGTLHVVVRINSAHQSLSLRHVARILIIDKP